MNEGINKKRMRERCCTLASAIQEAAEELRELRARIEVGADGTTDEELFELVSRVHDSVRVANSRAQDLELSAAPVRNLVPGLPGGRW